MKELDVIKLKKNLPEYGLKKGQKGTIVMTYGDPIKEIEVEFVDKKSGKTIAIVQLPIDLVEVIWKYNNSN